MRTVNMWQSDYGAFQIPDDVPIANLRKDGWFDRRRKITAELHSYFDAMTIRLRDDKGILSWREWKCE